MITRNKSIIATPPGVTIKEQLNDRGLTQKEFAVRMDMSEKHISKLINGEVQLTTDVAIRLESVLGISAEFWSNLEAIYREKIAKIEIENSMDVDMELSKKFPYTEMVKNGWIDSAKNATDKVKALRRFFEVVSLSTVTDNRVNRIACRRLSDTEKSDFALYAWAQKAKLEARYVYTDSINLNGLKKDIKKIRSMTVLPPSEFCVKLKNLLASRGIVLIYLPHIKGSFLHGATFYDANKIVVAMTVRGKDADKFWFSLFHELGHILLGHINNANGTTDDEEVEADNFAKEILIPEDKMQDFISKANFDKASLIKFADLIGIDKGIVVGRLQKEGLIPYNRFNDLKTKYKIA